jgi:PD-(D/E)XK nuclease superfamily
MIYSYSSLKQFDTCPRQFAEVRVWKKVTTAPTPATDYGVRAHAAFEAFVRDGTPLPADMAHYQQLADSMRNARGTKFCEIKYGLTADMQACAFFGRGVRVRGAADLVICDGDRAFIIDYKSGKDSRPDLGQLELMALMEFARSPQIEKVVGALIFFVAGTMTRRTWTRADIPALWAKWLAAMDKADRAIEAGVFQENPSGLCRGWCPVKECHHWQEFPPTKKGK